MINDLPKVRAPATSFPIKTIFKYREKIEKEKNLFIFYEIAEPKRINHVCFKSTTEFLIKVWQMKAFNVSYTNKRTQKLRIVN